MGSCGGKQHNNQKLHDNLIYEPQLPIDKQTPIDKLNYILSNSITDYLQMKRQNYDNLINKLVMQMNIQKSEFLSYNHLLVDHFKNIKGQQNHNKELIDLAINFMNQEFVQLINLETLLGEDLQLQLKTFKFLIDLYLILTTMKPDVQEINYWFGDYIKKYEEQGHQIPTQNNNEANTQIQFLKQILNQLNQSVQKKIINIQQQQKQQQLVKISSFKDEVMSKSTNPSEISIIHHARQQNLKYKAPI